MFRFSRTVACNGAVRIADHEDGRRSAAKMEVPEMTRTAFASLLILALEAGLCVLAILGGATAVLIAVLLASGILTW